MAKSAGKFGYVEVATASGTAAAAGIKDWSIDYTIDPLETTDFGASGAATYITGVSRWSGGFSGYKDGVPKVIGVNSVSLVLAVTSVSTSGWMGTAFITGIHMTNAFDGVATVNYDFQGTGSVTPPAI